jgi:cytoskeletal protein RodZ
MKTIGQIIKDARASRNISLERLADITKIKSSFIEAIEKNKWGSLPTFSIVLGFVKSLASALEIDPIMAVAVLKRDYPPKKININPKPDVATKFSWNPKLTFAIGTGVVILAILGYLGFQYYKFVSPPNLTVESPKENQVVTGNSVLVFGSTDSDVKITVNNQPVLIGENGKFSVEIGVTKSTNEIDIIAVSRSGKINEIERKISVQ